MKTLYNLRAFEITWTFVVLPGLFRFRSKPLYIQQAIQHSQDIARTGKMRLVRIKYRLAISFDSDGGLFAMVLLVDIYNNNYLYQHLLC